MKSLPGESIAPEWFGKRVDWIVCVVGEGLHPGSTDAYLGEGVFYDLPGM